jgi:hypothetical protein
MESSDILKHEIKPLAFDQYGTIVNIQKGLTEAVTPFLKQKGWAGELGSFVTWWRRTNFETPMIGVQTPQGKHLTFTNAVDIESTVLAKSVPTVILSVAISVDAV